MTNAMRFWFGLAFLVLALNGFFLANVEDRVTVLEHAVYYEAHQR